MRLFGAAPVADKMMIIDIMRLLAVRHRETEPDKVISDAFVTLLHILTESNDHEKFLVAHEKLEEFYDHPEKCKYDFFTQMVLSFYAYFIANYEAAAMIAAMACINEDGSPIAKMMTMCSLDVMGAPESADEYMTMLAEDIKEIEFIYLMKARQWLMAGNLDMFDHYLVRRMALKSFKHSRMREICQCRNSMIKNTVETSIESWIKNVAERFVHEDEDGTKNNDKKWFHHPNKRHIANYAGDFLDRFGRTEPVLIDFGCHAGTLDGMVAACTDRALKVIGIDHDKEPIELARKNHPTLTFHQGGIEKLLELNEKGDVLLLSFVCCLLKPEVVHAIAEYASKRIHYVILAEDISNMYGDFPVYRRHYLIHAYNNIFTKYGLDLLNVEMLIDPNEAANGILTFRNKEWVKE